MKYIKFFEAVLRKHQGGNLFSNNHRFPNLPKNCPMIDIDNIGKINNAISAIIEDKYTFESSLGNPITTKTWQKSQFLNICELTGLDLIFYETSTKIAKKAINNYKSIDYNNYSDFDVINTSDRIYVEIRNNTPAALMYRTENLRAEKLLNDQIFQISKQLADLLEVDLYLVNDSVGVDKKIYIKKYLSNEHVIIQNPFNSKDWIDAYDKLKLL